MRTKTANPTRIKKTVCLNMIVKNESAIIKRCLESVKSFIDYWVIVDTGSVDGTQAVIKEFLKDIPGELHERPWVNFGYNRNEALRLAKKKSDYLLFIDADDRLVYSDTFTLPELEADAYLINQKESYHSTFREHSTYFLIKNGLDFYWQGVLHETILADTPKNFGFLTTIYNEYINDGSRSKDPQKITKDIKLLHDGLKDEPFNARYRFYLARTYGSIRDHRSALEHFEKRAQMGGDELEVYHSLLFIAICQRTLHFPSEVFINSFCTAHMYRPSRAEAMYELARYFSETKNYFLGYFCAKLALSIPMTTDHLFVESWVYDWGAPLQAFVHSLNLGYVDEVKSLLKQLLDKPTLPKEICKDFQLEEWNSHLTHNNNLHGGNRMVS